MTKEDSFATLDLFVEHARVLRREADDAEEALLAFLYEGEQRRDIWAPTGRTFLEVVESANLCRAVRYLAWKRIREGLGADAVQGIGVHGIMAAAKLPTREQQHEVLDRVRRHEKTNGTSVSEQTANRIAKETKLLHVSTHGRTKGYLELQAENERLRQKLKAAEQTILALRTQLKQRASKPTVSKARRAG